MSKSVVRALKSMTVLLCIAAVCVTVLTVCNMFFPKYMSSLDAATASLINGICPTGKDSQTAFDDGYIVMLQENEHGVTLADFNKANKSSKAEVLAVYGEPRGENTGAYIIESKSAGRDGDVIILTAYSDGKIIGATVKKQGESYWQKLPADLFDKLEGVSGEVDMNGLVGKTGATLSLNAIDRAVNLSNKFALDYMTGIRDAISKKSSASLGGGK